MLTIDDIRNSIVHLREMDDDKVLTAIEDIFYDIIYADAPLYIAFIKTIPYMAPTTQDRQNFYLRLFSHKEIADAHKTNHPDLDIRELSVLETLQLAKTCFLCGGHGFILNEGDKWIGITLATYLRLFLTRVVNDQGSVQQGCVDLVWFINTLRRNSEYRYTALIRDGEWEGPNDSCLIQVDGPDTKGEDCFMKKYPHVNKVLKLMAKLFAVLVVIGLFIAAVQWLFAAIGFVGFMAIVITGFMAGTKKGRSAVLFLLAMAKELLAGLFAKSDTAQ